MTNVDQAPIDAMGASPAPFQASIPVGTRFSGTIAYDPAEAPNTQFDPGSTSYGTVYGQGKANADELTATVGGIPVYSQAGGLSVAAMTGAIRDAPGRPTTDVVFSNANFSDAEPYTAVAVSLGGGSQAIYPPLGPPAALNLADFALAEFSVQSPGGTSFRGTIDSLVPLVNTPEPATWLILGGGAAGYLAHRRRRRAGRAG